MRDGTIHVERLWKRFRADRPPKRLSDWVHLGRARHEAASRWRWVLRDVSLDIEPGESVGLMGMNGSGKSTFLKILNQVMYPHTGIVQVGGRVGALIALHAGIHPELTGRENVFLYGSLVGYRRSEIASRFDEIVEFADLSDAIDRQVKFYSTGMHMRLGFSIASALDPDVLLVDEVLAVGDAAFQQRCLDRMGELLDRGTTLFLVSHDLAVVEGLCKRGVWLDRGVVVADGSVTDVLEAYRATIELSAEREGGLDEGISVTDIAVTGPDGGPLRSQEPAFITVSLKCTEGFDGDLWVGISQGTAAPVLLFHHPLQLAQGETRLTCRLRFLPLPGGTFYLWGALRGAAGAGDAVHVNWRPFQGFQVIGSKLALGPAGVTQLAAVHVDAEWEQDSADSP